MTMTIITRRHALKVAAGAMPGLFLPAFGGVHAQSAKRLTVVNWGGAIAALKTAVFYEPFTRETGIQIVQASGPDLAKLRLQVQSGDAEWDVVDGVLPNWVPAAEQYNLFAKLDDGIVPAKSLPNFAARQSVVGIYFFTSGIVSASDRSAEQLTPQSWPDFWDVKAFPGRRGLFRRIGETLEMALIADGVKPSEVYPCDVERGFAALDRIKPFVTNWYTTSAQSVQLVVRNECDFAHGYATFVGNAVADGAKLRLPNRNNFIGVNWAGVSRVSRSRDEAMRLLAFILRPDRQAAFAEAGMNAPVTLGVFEGLPKATQAKFPDLNDSRNCVLNLDWWAGKEEGLARRFNEWVLR